MARTVIHMTFGQQPNQILVFRVFLFLPRRFSFLSLPTVGAEPSSPASSCRTSLSPIAAAEPSSALSLDAVVVSPPSPRLFRTPSPLLSSRRSVASLLDGPSLLLPSLFRIRSSWHCVCLGYYGAPRLGNNEKTVILSDFVGSPVPGWFEWRGWTPLLLATGNVCLDLVREFYANLVPSKDDDSFTSYVRGHDIYMVGAVMS
ncbi:hypothetical protein U1Q18_021657 [Sarracenia purpurea var. burkii]